ncbi:MAG: hypothetical protein JXQ87_10815 [Bacteroidia bacterium]
MDNGARIRINRETGEVEISGSEQFVKEHIGLVQNVLNITEEAPAPAKPAPKAAPAKKAPAKPVAKKAAPVKKAAAPAPAKAVAKEEPTPAPVKRGRGRPRKNPVAAPAAAKPAATKAPAKKAPVKKAPVKKAAAKKVVAKKAAPAKAAKEPKVASSFSAYMKSFKRKMKKGDWILAAGYYFLTSTNSDTFSTFNTSKLLKSQGVELANPSQYMKNNVSSGRIEAVGKRAYKVTDTGKNYLNLLMTKK